ncbi:MAG: hypothetical protein KatS3mg089_0099 [Patescibacteria group bacterium]|nr:MAG: hypothetical protein KatS3mg089_0099 [Patescibacteria group bacterium]
MRYITPSILLVGLIIIGAAFRITHLDWGKPFYFHPDERNIATSIDQLLFPDQMNPHFFAYGSLPLYLSYFAALLFNLIKNQTWQNDVSFENAILTLRFFSSLLSLLLLLLLYSTGKILKNNISGILATILGTVSVGLIQFAHFGTYEMWLTYFTLLLFFLSLLYIKTHKRRYLVGIAITFGILISFKISSIILLPLLIMVIIIEQKSQQKISIISSIFFILFTILLSSAIFLSTNPYTFLDYSSFLGSIKYESSVALGGIRVFYTGEFLSATPIVFPFLKIYPFLLNPFIVIVFLVSFAYLFIFAIQRKNIAYMLLIAFFLLLFLSQTFLFTQWTRYFVPTIPFIYLIIACALSEYVEHIQMKSKVLISFAVVSFIIGFIFAYSYLQTVLLTPDSRIMAAEWAKKHLPQNAKIISEVYDLGILPFNSYFPSIKLFNFYDLEETLSKSYDNTLSNLLKTNDYIILPSQRLFKTRVADARNFPKGYEFYTSLISQPTAYDLLYQTPCDLYCKILYLGDPIFAYEQTANIFDRPVVMIYKIKK